MVALLFYYFLFSIAGIMWSLLIMTFLMNLLDFILKFMRNI